MNQSGFHGSWQLKGFVAVASCGSVLYMPRKWSGCESCKAATWRELFWPMLAWSEWAWRMTWGMTWGMSLDCSEVRLNSPVEGLVVYPIIYDLAPVDIVFYPTIYKVLYIPGGWSWDFWTISGTTEIKRRLENTQHLGWTWKMMTFQIQGCPKQRTTIR